MATSFKVSEAYRQYFAGRPGEGLQLGRTLRLEGLPGFNKNDDGQTIIAAGEVYCRVMINGTLCPHNERFSSESNLRKHISRHEDQTIKDRRSGSYNMNENLKATAFYERLIQEVEGTPGPGGIAPPPIVTPSKKGKGGTKARVKQLELPVAQSGPNKGKIAHSKLKTLAAMKGTCDGCKIRKDKCPPKVRTAACMVWGKFKFNVDLEDTTGPGSVPAVGSSPSAPVELEGDDELEEDEGSSEEGIEAMD